MVADIESYDFPAEIDIVFAFASLIHVPKESLRDIFSRVYEALNKGGIFRLSMKYTDVYQEITKTDEFGTRTYYFYSQKDILNLNPGFSVLKMELINLRGQEWLEILFQK